MKGKERNKRRSMNAVSLFVTCLVLFVAVQFSDGGGLFASKINKITENLDKAVLGLNENVSYTDFTDHSVYLSNTTFHARGMTGLYNLTKMFVDICAPENILMDGMLSVNPLEFHPPEVKIVLKYYAGLVAIVLFLVLCVPLFPICGLCFCCCRCCGNCGAKPLPSGKKKDVCKKVIQASLLIMCGTALLFCVVCAFGSNQQLQDGIESFPKNMQNSVQDTKTFLSATNSHVSNLLGTNYNEFSEGFFQILINGTDIAMEQLNQYSNASAVSEITLFVDNLSNINETLIDMKSGTNKLRVLASQLNDALRKVKRDLGKNLQQCLSPACSEMKSKIDRLQTSIDFNSVPDVSSTLLSLNSFKLEPIQKAVQQANNQLKSIRDKIESYLQEGLAEAKSKIKDTGSVINETLDTISNTIANVNTQIHDNTSPAIQATQNFIDKYGQYRYYVGLSISCVLLLVIIFIVLGLICGICGKRPDGYSDNCCNKGAGGQFLICAVMIMFLFGFIISVITLISLVVGVISEKAICDPLRTLDPNNNIIKLLDGINLNLDIEATPVSLLRNCYQNKSIYQTFGLKNKFNIDEIRSKFNIDEQLNKIDLSGAIDGSGFKLIDDEQLAALNELKRFEPNINVEKFAEELETNLTNYSIDELTGGLGRIIDEHNGADEVTFKSQLRLSLLHLNTYNEKLILPMKQLSKDLLANATQLNEDLKMNKTSFAEAIEGLIEEITSASDALEHNGKDTLNNTTIQFKNVIKAIVETYIDRVDKHVTEEIGQCGPLSVVINATLTSTCEKVLLPWNGFWFSLFWSIILYVITIVISIKLANLYRKHKPYDQYVETEYLYDAYADRGDNIPLNSRGGKRGKKKGKKSKRYDDRPNVGREVARDYAAGSHPPDGRYADMAPKHWEEFPNGGPPHYQRAPTEYERPPPYYYPGSGGE